VGVLVKGLRASDTYGLEPIIYSILFQGLGHTVYVGGAPDYRGSESPRESLWY
jgi:hypothetical protein